MHYKGLTHMIVEAGRSQYLQIWLPEDPGDLMFQCVSEGKREADVPVQRQGGRRDSFSLERESAFFFYSGFQPVGPSPFMLGRAICFTQFTD